MTPEEIDAIVDTFPLTATAAMMGTSEDKIRAVTRAAVTKAVVEGGSIDNMRRVMEVALGAYSRMRR